MLTITITLTDEEVELARREFTSRHPITGEVEVIEPAEQIPAIIRHSVINPILQRQRAYEKDARAERMAKATAQDLAEIDAILQKSGPEVEAAKLPPGK